MSMRFAETPSEIRTSWLLSVLAMLPAGVLYVVLSGCYGGDAWYVLPGCLVIALLSGLNAWFVEDKPDRERLRGRGGA